MKTKPKILNKATCPWIYPTPVGVLPFVLYRMELNRHVQRLKHRNLVEIHLANIKEESSTTTTSSIVETVEGIKGNNSGEMIQQIKFPKYLPKKKKKHLQRGPFFKISYFPNLENDIIYKIPANCVVPIHLNYNKVGVILKKLPQGYISHLL